MRETHASSVMHLDDDDVDEFDDELDEDELDDEDDNDDDEEDDEEEGWRVARRDIRHAEG